ncbi:MAG: hypothetical protein WD063_11350 [Pirellulales bacterium]
MMHDFLPSPPSRKRDPAQIAKEFRSFAAFDRWMDDELERLVAQWMHTAAPNASRSWRIERKLRQP